MKRSIASLSGNVRLTAVEKLTVVAIGASAALLLLLPPFDPRWILFCLIYLLIAFVATTVSFLKGRRPLAAAGANSMIWFALGTLFLRWQLNRPEVSGPGYPAFAIIYALPLLASVALLLLLAVVGAVGPARSDSRWATTKAASAQSRSSHSALVHENES